MPMGAPGSTGLRMAGGGGGVFYVMAKLLDMVSPGLKQIGMQAMATNNVFIRNARKWNMGSVALTRGLNVMNTVAVATMASIVGLSAAYARMSKEVINFERELVNMNSILMESTDTMWDLGNSAVELSTKYNKTADEIASGMYHLASAGLEANEVVSVLTPTMQLAVATQGDYMKIAKDVVQVIKGFGLEMSEATRIADLMVYTIQHSLVTWDKLGEGIKFAMPWFAAAGLSIEELTAAVGLLSDRALEAGIGGRGLRQSLAMLIREVTEGAEKFEKLGISVADAEGNMLPLLTVVKQFRAAYPEMNVEAIADMMDILGIRGATAFSHLVVGMEEYEKKLNNLSESAGTAERVAEEQMKSLSAQFTILKNQFLAPFKTEEFAENVRSVFEEIKPLVENLAGPIANFILRIGTMLKNLLQNINLESYLKTILQVGGSLVGMLNAFNSTLGKVSLNFLILFKALGMNRAAMAAASAMTAQMNLDLQRSIMLEAALKLGIDEEAFSQMALIEQKRVRQFLEQSGITIMKSSTVAQKSQTAAEHEYVGGVTAAMITSQAEQETTAMGIPLMQASQMTRMANTEAVKDETLSKRVARETQDTLIIGYMNENGQIQINANMLMQDAHSQALANRQKKQAALTQGALTAAMSLGTFAVMQYAQGNEALAHALTLAASAMAYYTAWSMVRQSTKYGVYAPVVAGILAATAGGIIYSIGQKMKASREEMFSGIDDIDFNVTDRPEYQVEALGYGATAQQGGYVSKEGMAWLHKDEMVVPAEETNEEYTINIDLRGAVITRDEREFNELIGNAALKFLERKQRVR